MKIIEPGYEILTPIDGEEVLKTIEKEVKCLINYLLKHFR